jgi:putative glycosyltransferase (TIGR04372 family)
MDKLMALFRVTLWLFLTFISMPVLILILLISPIFRIRFGYLDANRIGHFCFDLGYFIFQKNNRAQSKGSTNVFFLRGPVSNVFLKALAKQYFFVHPLVGILVFVLKGFPRGLGLIVEPQRTITGSRDTKGMFAKSSFHINFLDSQTSTGYRYLESCGVDPNDRWVCLCVRDSAYLNTFLPKTTGDWTYHDFRDSDIDNYLTAAEYLAEEGVKVFRMGKTVSKPMPSSHPSIIDYASSEQRSDFLDVWLIANCYFCISTNLGLDAVSLVFKRPLLIVNALPLMHIQSYHESIFVPKHLHSEDTGLHFGIKEYVETQWNNTDAYRKARIRVSDLQPSEITAVTKEMNERLKGCWTETTDEYALQQKFWQIMRENKRYTECHDWIHPSARIGQEFLRSIT